MKTKKLKAAAEWLSDPAHAIVAGVAVVLAVAAVWLAVSKIRSAIQNAREDANAPKPNTSNLTPGLNFAELARRIWDATVEYKSLGVANVLILNMPTGTDEDEVYAVLGTLRTNDDYLALKKAWRSLYDSKSDLLTWLNPNTVSTLPGILHSELTQSELQQARNILEENNITPDF